MTSSHAKAVGKVAASERVWERYVSSICSTSTWPALRSCVPSASRSAGRPVGRDMSNRWGNCAQTTWKESCAAHTALSLSLSLSVGTRAAHSLTFSVSLSGCLSLSLSLSLSVSLPLYLSLSLSLSLCLSLCLSLSAWQMRAITGRLDLGSSGEVPATRWEWCGVGGVVRSGVMYEVENSKVLKFIRKYCHF